MKPWKGLLLLVLAVFPLSIAAQQWKIPTAMRKLDNGLVVVVSENHSAPVVGLCMSYGIGFRLEPQGRTGFAHLFEHMMFEGTPQAPKGVLDKVIEGGGGFLNGDTRYDYTEYIESAPVSALDPILWLEADRMKTLDFSPANLENQRNVVEEEVRVNVLNQPYGLFYAINLPMKAFDTYPNAHNFYGDFRDLDAATIQNVQDFYQHYYAPNNAVLAITGDVKPDEVFAKVQKYFAAVPRRDVSPRPNVAEPPQQAERRGTEQDAHAKVPALAIAYRMPPRQSHDAVVAAVVGDLLHNGDASALYQSLVKEKKVALEVSGGVNWPLGNPFEYDGPTLMTSFIVYPPNVPETALEAAYDATISELASKGPSPQALERIRTKMRSDWYGQMEIPIDRASLISHATLFDGKPDRVNTIPDELARVTAGEVRDFARKYLVRNNRTLINRVPCAAAKAGQTGGAQ